MSEVLATSLEIFYPKALQASFDNGFTVSHGSDHHVIHASFAGILADEKALKEAFGLKGQAGNVLCPDCRNVRNRWCDTSTGGLQKYWDPNLDQRQKIRQSITNTSPNDFEMPPQPSERRLRPTQVSTTLREVFLFNHYLMKEKS